MKRALVTGAAGFIGSKLVAELVSRGVKIYALIKKGNEQSRNLLAQMEPPIEIIDDLTFLLANAETFPCFDFIYHLAAVGIRPDSNDIDLICDVNIKMGCQLVDFAKRNRSGLLVNFGSCFEYGNHGDILLTEDMDCRPESLYAISKNASTNLVTAYAKSQKVNMITVRPFGVFGEGESAVRLAPSIIRSCLKGEVIKTTLGEQIRDFVNVKDLVKAIYLLSVSQYTPFEIYNICSDNPVRVKDFITEIVNVCGFDLSQIAFGDIPYRQNEPMVFAGNNKKLQDIIHYPFPKNHISGILDIYQAIKSEG